MWQKWINEYGKSWYSKWLVKHEMLYHISFGVVRRRIYYKISLESLEFKKKSIFNKKISSQSIYTLQLHFVKFVSNRYIE